MRLPFRGRFCSLAAASLLTGACGGRATADHVGGGGQAGSSGAPAASSGQAGANVTIGGAAFAAGGSPTIGGTAAGSGGSDSIVSAGGSAGGACALPCASSSCVSCIDIEATAPADTCVISPTASRVEGVRFDCVSLDQGPNGYDLDSQSQLVLTGDACDALQASAPHRIEVVLGCPLDK